MARIWSEPYDSSRHGHPMGWAFPEPEGLKRHHRARTLEPHAVLFVRVAAFTFQFHSLEQLQACRAFYAQRHQPTSRLPVATGDYGGDHSECQRWFERLPLYLREEPKRVRVVAALEAAVHAIGKGEFRLAAV